MMRAIWNGVVLAESAHTELLEGHYYFPPGTVKPEFLRRSTTQINCPWKGMADFCHLEVDGERCENAAWYFPAPKPEAREIRNYIAFGDSVEIEIVEAQAVCLSGQ
ncbi:DUF427 domain-containing protein [Planctomicrobium piriforme]|uniref:Uncharacterized conserved protein, DUF427 family n=1 Tax=Planctomicrobium piriforme TaxID=1576369 RepID=A0A1I3BFG0_9PLAN|nr:DUF427 domain-containing protein [Planctomicrobium piriforme]SFH61037.1 Uncharacterized conserved protein, DUF427 family [Planctomicrobium piriforme]